ncbi:vesicle transport protein [Anaeramoeba flamelloides]|uniref:Vesicle transport protein n=1 Tax=Anaeramoeba flamelloides TaxID=1746091 RepID=A0AAV7ZER1_9EUKA|nr:vesicle transport protein [Anaeramoeba flamelloides]
MKKKIKNIFKDEPDNQSLMDEVKDSVKMSRKNRLKASIGCFLLGVLCFFFAALTVSPIPLFFNPSRFPIPYVIGNILIVASMFFVVGPMKCVRSVTKPKRIVSFVIYLICTVLVLYVAIKTKSFAGTIIILIIQILAFGWLVLSYVPFGKRITKKVCSSCV